MVGNLEAMNVEDLLQRAIFALHSALPDSSSWSGPAAAGCEARLREQIAVLGGIQGGLWG